MKRVGTVDWVLRGTLAALVVSFVAVVAWAVYEKPIHVVEAGEPAPNFRITADSGRNISVPNFGGKLLILNFWASWCPPCVEETPSLSQFARDYASKGVVVLGVSVDTSEPAYANFVRKFNPQFLTARDKVIHRDYGTFIYPETYFIDASGKVVQKIAQGADWSDPKLRAYVDSLL